MSRLTEADVIALAAAVAGEGGGGGTGDGDMKKSVYDANDLVKDAGGIPAYVDAQLPGNATTTDAGFMSADDKIKLNNIESGAEANVQSDWNQSSSNADDFIKNKPTLGDLAAKDSASATYTPEGTIKMQRTEDTMQIGFLVSAPGRNPQFDLDDTDNELLILTPTIVPRTGSSTHFVTGVGGYHNVEFKGTEATITST